MLSIEMLPARHGDCLWIEYGTGGDRHRILIDGGPGFAYPALKARIEKLPKAERHFELLVITHIDADHIEGIIRLLGDPELGVTYDDVWYNAWKQISAGIPAPFGAEAGEYLSALIPKLGLRWNHALGQTPATPVPVKAGAQALATAGGARFTLLSPTLPKLVKLRDAWQKELDSAGLEPDQPEAALERLKESKRFSGVSFAAELDPEALAAAPFSADKAPANGSSIAFLLEAGGKRVLLLGDAHPDAVEASLGTGRLEVDAVKLAHHGSQNNTSQSLIAKLSAEHWLFSSDGTFFNHPDPEAVARVIMGANRPQLLFNYRTKRTAIWDDPALQQRYKYETVYPENGQQGLLLNLA